MILGSDSCPIRIQYSHTTTGITSNTKILATYFTEGTQAIRPSCTQAAMATHGNILYYYGKKSLIGCLICQDILYIEPLLSEHTKIFQKKSKRIIFSCPSDEFAVGNSGSTLVYINIYKYYLIKYYLIKFKFLKIFWYFFIFFFKKPRNFNTCLIVMLWCLWTMIGPLRVRTKQQLYEVDINLDFCKLYKMIKKIKERG